MITLFKIFFKRKLLFKKRRSLKMRALAKQKKPRALIFSLALSKSYHNISHHFMPKTYFMSYNKMVFKDQEE
jgi:hypothetical protein